MIFRQVFSWIGSLIPEGIAASLTHVKVRLLSISASAVEILTSVTISEFQLGCLLSTAEAHSHGMLEGEAVG